MNSEEKKLWSRFFTFRLSPDDVTESGAALYLAWVALSFVLIAMFSFTLLGKFGVPFPFLFLLWVGFHTDYGRDISMKNLTEKVFGLPRRGEK